MHTINGNIVKHVEQHEDDPQVSFVFKLKTIKVGIQLCFMKFLVAIE